MGFRRFVNKPFHYFIILICGCAALDTVATDPGVDSRSGHILEVPFFRQAGDDCGPAALASVLAYFGKDRDISEIISGIYTPRLRGSLPMDMERYARSTGLAAESMHGSLDLLRSHIDRGNPVICLLDLGFWVYRRPHYVTVVGYDSARQAVFMHDGAVANRAVSCSSFDSAWRRAGRWMLIIGREGDAK